MQEVGKYLKTCSEKATMLRKGSSVAFLVETSWRHVDLRNYRGYNFS